MRTARNPDEPSRATALPVLTLNIDFDQLVAVLRRHVRLTPNAARAIQDDCAKLFQAPRILVLTNTPSRNAVAAADTVLSTQAAADLVGVSRPYLVARIGAGDIRLHQQVGNQRRVLKSAVLAWHRKEQTRRRKALGHLGTDLDREISAG